MSKKHYDVTDDILRKELQAYGEVVFAKVVRDREGKSRGYGFVEFARTSDFLQAFRNASGRKILGRKIIVDAEYARTRKYFRPTRLGGGLGHTRRSKAHPYQR